MVASSKFVLCFLGSVSGLNNPRKLQLHTEDNKTSENVTQHDNETSDGGNVTQHNNTSPSDDKHDGGNCQELCEQKTKCDPNSYFKVGAKDCSDRINECVKSCKVDAPAAEATAAVTCTNENPSDCWECSFHNKGAVCSSRDGFFTGGSCSGTLGECKLARHKYFAAVVHFDVSAGVGVVVPSTWKEQSSNNVSAESWQNLEDYERLYKENGMHKLCTTVVSGSVPNVTLHSHPGHHKHEETSHDMHHKHEENHDLHDNDSDSSNVISPYHFEHEETSHDMHHKHEEAHDLHDNDSISTGTLRGLVENEEQKLKTACKDYYYKTQREIEL